jgi:hypothetical protein
MAITYQAHVGRAIQHLPWRCSRVSSSTSPHRPHTLCERKKRAAEALAYNGLVQSFPAMARLGRDGATHRPEQTTILDGE